MDEISIHLNIHHIKNWVFFCFLKRTPCPTRGSNSRLWNENLISRVRESANGATQVSLNIETLNSYFKNNYEVYFVKFFLEYSKTDKDVELDHFYIKINLFIYIAFRVLLFLIYSICVNNDSLTKKKIPWTILKETFLSEQMQTNNCICWNLKIIWW